MLPQTPLLFMGQEWAAATPFRFFTDHAEELGRKVREGRRREFGQYRAFQDSTILDRLADPQDEAAFLASQLDWAEREREPHASTLRLHEALIALRRRDSVFCTGTNGAFRAIAAGEDSLILVYQTEVSVVCVSVQLRGHGVIAMESIGQPGCRERSDRRGKSFSPRRTPDMRRILKLLRSIRPDRGLRSDSIVPARSSSALARYDKGACLASAIG